MRNPYRLLTWETSRFLLAAAATALLACGDPTGPDAPCQQTFEFGNVGCAEVAGIVTGLSGQPLPGRLVRVSPAVPHGAAYSGGSVRADAQGRFRTRIFRMTQTMAPLVPDTFSVWVVAIDVASTELPNPTNIRDSVLRQLTLRPVGQRPVTIIADITLSL